MKIAIVGGTGLVATELIAQCLAMPEITSVVALARKPIQLEADTINRAKFKSVVIRDYEEFTESVKADISGLDVCIWTVAVTPGRLGRFDFAEVKRVCQDCTVAGLKAVSEVSSVSAKPATFIYMSAEGTPEDLTKKPFFLGDYLIMRGRTDKLVQEFGKESGHVDVHIVRPGMVWSLITFWRSVLANFFRVLNLLTRAIPNISRTELAAAILDQAVSGFEKEHLSNADLVRIGGAALGKKANH
ncbi:NAD(P)-binding protein [Apiospora hydei]|uniref:NAD(P)-binding protein n=1 Tax=Apiospora hydei TaxID=1337664 RepID=A0ABR1UUR5_9PEZI